MTPTGFGGRGIGSAWAGVPGYDYTEDPDLSDEDRALLNRRVPHPMQDVRDSRYRRRYGRARSGEFDPDMQTAQ